MFVTRFIPCFLLLGCASSPGSIADAMPDESAEALDAAKEVTPGTCSLTGACCCVGDVRGGEPRCSGEKATCEVAGMLHFGDDCFCKGGPPGPCCPRGALRDGG